MRAAPLHAIILGSSLVSGCASAPPDVKRAAPLSAASGSATTTTSLPDASTSSSSGAVRRDRPPTQLGKLVNLRTSAYDEAPAPLVPASIEGGDSGYWLEESRPDGTRSAWLVRNWTRIRPGLYQSYVIARATSRRSPDDPPSTASGILLWTPAGRVVKLDADSFVASDREGTILIGTRGNEPRVWALPPGIGETDNPVPIAVPTNLPEGLTEGGRFSPFTLRMLDASHLFLREGVVLDVPSFQTAATFPKLVIVGGPTALLYGAAGGYDIAESFTGKTVAQLPDPAKPTKFAADGGATVLETVSYDGRWIAWAGTGVWVADTHATPPQSKQLSTHALAAKMRGNALSITGDGTAACLTEDDKTTLYPIGARPSAPAGTVEIGIPSEVETGAWGTASRCDTAYLPVLPGLTPVPPEHDDGVDAFYPVVLERDRKWIAAIYVATWRGPTAPTDAEVVIADPETGKVLHRQVVLSLRPPSTDPASMRTFMQLDAGLGDEVHVRGNSGEDYVDWIIDVATGDMKEQQGYVLPLKGGKHCLFDDGRIGEAWECGDAPKP